jgi:hypothetical protein
MQTNIVLGSHEANSKPVSYHPKEHHADLIVLLGASLGQYEKVEYVQFECIQA